MVKLRLFLLPAFALLLTAAPARAQWISMEVRGGAGVGNYSPSGAGLEIVPRPAFSAQASVNPFRFLSVYAGYGQSGFGCREGFCRGVEPTFRSAGPQAGIRLAASGIWARGGVNKQTIDVAWPEGSDEATGSLGYEGGAGFSIPLAARFALTPGITWIGYTLESGPEAGSSVSVVVVDVGVRVSF